jgi:hypothetical protein
MRAERPVNGRTYYHVTGEKPYALGDAADDSCKMNLSFDGVVATDRTGRVAFENVSAFAYAEYCGDAASWNELIPPYLSNRWPALQCPFQSFRAKSSEGRRRRPLRLSRRTNEFACAVRSRSATG